MSKLTARARRSPAHPGVAILELRGRLAGETIEVLERALAACRSHGLAHVVLDLEALEEEGVDQAGLGALLKLGTAGDGRLAICRPPRSIRALMEMLLLTRILEVHDDLESGLRWAASGAKEPGPGAEKIHAVLATDEWCKSVDDTLARRPAGSDSAPTVDRLVTRPHAGRLSFVHARCSRAGAAGHLTYLSGRHLGELGIDAEALHARGIASLAALLAEGAFSISRLPQRGSPRLVIVEGDEHLVAGLVGVPALVQRLRTMLGGDPLVATPGRDVLFAFRSDGLRDPRTAEVIASAFERSPRPLDRSVRRLRPGGEVVLVREG